MAKGYLLGQITISGKSQYKIYDAKIGDVIKEFGGNTQLRVVCEW